MDRIKNVKENYEELHHLELLRKLKRSNLVSLLMRCNDEELRELEEEATKKNKKLFLRHLTIVKQLKSKGISTLRNRMDVLA